MMRSEVRLFVTLYLTLSYSPIMIMLSSTKGEEDVF